MHNYTVYIHTFPNKKVYIGITSLNPKYRFGRNGSNYNNTFVGNAIVKYGWNNINHKILYTNLTKEEAEAKEIELIAKYKSNQKEFGYNIANGGNCIGSHSDETKLKIALASKNRKHSDETKLKISNAHKGKKLSNETKEKIRLATIKSWNTTSFRQKMIEKHKGTKILCVELNTIFDSYAEAYRITGATNIKRCCEGITKTANGYHWKYVK